MTAFKEYKLRHSIRIMRESSDQMTPWELALQMADAIPSHLFNTQALVPGSGMGTFALALVYRGWDSAKIVCIELDAGFALYTKVRSPEIQTVHTDYLTWEPNMKFDVVIGNPPYQRPREVRNVGAPLWPDFIEKSTALVKDGGYVSFVVPSTWMKKSSRAKAWKTIENNDLISVMPNVKWAFPSVGGGTGFTVFGFLKQTYSGKTVVDGKFEININANVPINNSQWTEDLFKLLNSGQILDLDVKAGPVDPSINSDHFSVVKTKTHIYEVFYSTTKNRRSMWCDQPIGDHGKLKLAIGTYGDIYSTAKITTVGCGRQVNYVLGTQEELERLLALFYSNSSKQCCEANAFGAFRSPLHSIVNA